MLSRLKILLVPTVVLVLAAGMVIGRISSKLPVAATQPTEKPGGWFDEQLNLSADQRKQMDAIWGDVRQNMGKTFEGRQTIDKERDQAIRDLLSDDQKKQYDAIYESYRAKRTEMDKQREKMFADANQRSRALLNEEQQKRWDVLSKERQGRGRGGRGGRPGSQPSTRPFGGPGQHGPGEPSPGDRIER